MTTTTLKTWWTRDTPLHTYVFVIFIIGMPFAVFSTYVIYQMQLVGYTIGADVDGQPCATYCIVPWGNARLDLNSVLLYLNALSYGLGGACSLFLCAYSDFWARKHWLLTFFMVCYGVFSIPAYWLQGYTEQDFAVLSALFVLFQIVGLLVVIMINTYIPYCMRQVQETESVLQGDRKIRSADVTPLSSDATVSAQRRYGFNMTVYGSVAVSVGGVLAFIVTIILSQTLSGEAAQSSGLLVTTVVGFIAVATSVVALLGLPPIPSKPISSIYSSWTGPLVEFFAPFRDIYTRKSLGALLVAYTIYSDTNVAIASVTSQLYISEIRPGALEYSLYALTQTLLQLVLTLIFLWFRPHLNVKLETWLIVGYALMLVVPTWGCIGLANVNFGFKMRWEFYIQLLITRASGALVDNTFRTVFSEMLPPGNEVRWVGMQLVLSCATVWVNYVASGPLQDATHQLRFLLILSLMFYIVSLILEVCRVTVPVFIRDRRKWLEFDRAVPVGSEASSDSHGVVKETQVQMKGSAEM